MKRKKVNRILIKDRHQISGFKEETVAEALLNVKRMWETIDSLSVDELKNILPPQLILNSRVGTLRPGTIYYRARITDAKNYRNIGYWDASQFWEAPKEYVKHWGRLNRPHESVLYLSSDVSQTFKEIRYQVKKSRHYAVVVNSYKVTKPITATQIGYFGKSGSVADIYSKMISDIFSLPSEKFGENVYKLSNFLSNFYNFVPNNAAAFFFTPVLNPQNDILNLAINPSDAHKYFEYNGSIVIPKYRESVDGNITVVSANDDAFNLLDPSKNKRWIFDNFKIKY
ncbi:hypothetical protein [Levilactobacillus angrenensis]|uniref:RES domain-containing protein n=1 Tax=Levilactobacillus angrenensis TaxID=2486020 RepID=A0ABW1UCV5_9LACO|nr:hypothetical protein [Levilactobacillus angrenensis]